MGALGNPLESLSMSPPYTGCPSGFPNQPRAGRDPRPPIALETVGVIGGHGRELGWGGASFLSYIPKGPKDPNMEYAGLPY